MTDVALHLEAAPARPESPAGPAAARARDDSDRSDVEAARAGDGLGYERIIERHQSAVAAWMWRFTRDKNTLEELSQEVFVEAYYSLKSFRGGSSFRTWLLAIATRVGYGFWKRTAREQKRSADAHLLLAGDPVEDGPSEAADALFGVLETLPPKERLVLTLMYFEELSVAEIAAATGWSASLVKVRAYRARQRLKGLLAQAGFGGDK